MPAPLRARRVIVALIAALCFATTVATIAAPRQDACARHQMSVRATAGTPLHAHSRRVPAGGAAVVPSVALPLATESAALAVVADARPLAAIPPAHSGRGPPVAVLA